MNARRAVVPLATCLALPPEFATKRLSRSNMLDRIIIADIIIAIAILDTAYELVGPARFSE
jgi:hypothetical protein